MDNETKMLLAITKRYGSSLANLSSALSEDEDVVLANLDDDLNGEVSQELLMEYITLCVGWVF